MIHAYINSLCQIQYTKPHFFRVLEKWLVGNLTPNFFFSKEADSWTQTRDLSLFVEGNCHHTKCSMHLKKISTYRLHQSININILDISPHSFQTTLQFLKGDLSTAICVYHLEHFFQACDFLFRQAFSNDLPKKNRTHKSYLKNIDDIVERPEQIFRSKHIWTAKDNNKLVFFIYQGSIKPRIFLL